MTEQEKADATERNNLSVVDRVLVEFIDAVAAEDGYSEISVRLKHTMLDERDFSEAALERALFGVEQ
ncbi:hypothetical protein AB9E29_21595 [Rhizobium leguminosarum]|uniref:hypothetical protein n=1 Tax=Rhizobium leguminosarum TaxID=384 RepID=UPI003F974EB8